MKTRLLILLIAIVICLSAVMHGALFVPADVDAGGFPTVSIPTFTFTDPSVWPVDIPDANLDAALHEICGKSMSEPLLRGDLAALTGNLNLADKNIANLEGIQFCVNIERLYANNNPLSSLPNMTGMTGLKALLLWDCQFTVIPVTLANVPNLTNLDMSMNQLSDVSGINGSTSLKQLNLMHNRLSELPDPLDLPNLKLLFLMTNLFEVFPQSVIHLSSLTQLVIDDNSIRDLPAEIATMPSLQTLSAFHNKIRAIPPELGNSNLKTLYLRSNQISSLPAELFNSGHLETLNVSINRLTRVPSEINRINYSWLILDFNFMDISPGSTNATILASVNAANIKYSRQLTPVTNLRYTPTDSSILLAWDPSPDSDDFIFTAEVRNYIVYLVSSGTLTALATLNKDVTMYADIGLSAGQERRYQVSVVYNISSMVSSEDIQHDTSISARTATPTPSPSPEPSTTASDIEPTDPKDEPSHTVPVGTTSAPTTEPRTAANDTEPTDPKDEASGTEPAETTGSTTTTSADSPDPISGSLPTWLYIVIGVVAAGALAAAVTLLIMRKKTNISAGFRQ